MYVKDAPTPSKKTCSLIFIESLFIITRNWKQPTYNSAAEWKNNMCYSCTMRYYLVIKKKYIINFADKWMKLENISSEVTQTQRNTLIL